MTKILFKFSHRQNSRLKEAKNILNNSCNLSSIDLRLLDSPTNHRRHQTVIELRDPMYEQKVLSKLGLQATRKADYLIIETHERDPNIVEIMRTKYDFQGEIYIFGPLSHADYSQHKQGFIQGNILELEELTNVLYKK